MSPSERTPRVEHMLLEALDWAAAAAEPGTAARLLAAQADLLGVMAAGQGGLRSGPAGNAAWQPAIHALEVRGRRRSGVKLSVAGFS